MPDRLDVMLVDDDPFTRMTLVTTLQSLGCRMVVDAATAVETADAFPIYRPEAANHEPIAPPGNVGAGGESGGISLTHRWGE